MPLEVILCGAGAFGTPQLLEAGGLGPKDELQKLGVPVVRDMQRRRHKSSGSIRDISRYEDIMTSLECRQ